MCTGTLVRRVQTVRERVAGPQRRRQPVWSSCHEGGCSECVQVHRYNMTKRSGTPCQALA